MKVFVVNKPLQSVPGFPDIYPLISSQAVFLSQCADTMW